MLGPAGAILAAVGVLALSPAQPDEWTAIDPAGETGCAFGTPYRFFHREGPDPSKLLVWFQGGGACWEWVSCSGMFDTSVAEDELDGYGGVFDLDRADNPFAEYSVVFVPYCTGDVHVGDSVARYGDPAWDAPPVRHRGYANVTAVLAWIERELPPPERLVVAGASAGSYGALFHAPRLAALFPSAGLVVLGDSGVPLLHGYPRILEGWGAGRVLRDLWISQGADGDPAVTLEVAHAHLARRWPDARIAHVTTDRDAVQAAFYVFSGSPDWRGATLDLLAALEERIPTFHAFVLRGEDHGLLRTDRFYAYEEDRVRLRGWIEDLVTGEPVGSRYCEECDPAGR